MWRADSFGSCFDLPVSVGALPGHRASGVIATESWPPCKCIPAVWHSARRRVGKLSSLEEGKASTESVFSGLYLQQVFCFSDVRPAGLLRGPQFQSQGRVSPCAFRALQTHSWVRVALPMRKKAAGVRLRSGAMMGSPGRGHLAHQMVPRQGVTDQPLAGDIPKRGAKLAGSEGGKQQWDGISKQLLGHTALGLPGERCELWLLGPISRGHAQGVSLQDPGMFQTDLGSLAVARLHRFRCLQEKQAPCGP